MAESIPDWPPMVDGEIHWGDWRGRPRTYRGPVQDLGIGIPRNAPGHGFRRALFDVAYGYVSGFPVRDILAYSLRSLWPSPIREAVVTAEEA